MPLDIHPERTEILSLHKGDRSRLREIVGACLVGAFVAFLLIYCVSPARADHDLRDPDGICLNHARVAAIWAERLRDEGKTKAEAEQAVAVTPEALEQVPPPFRKLLLQHTVKGIELVYDAKPEKTPAEVYEAFYEWCVTNLPKKAPDA